MHRSRKKRTARGNYRLTENAKEDLKRIYRRGLHEYGEAQADKYYNAFFDRFEQIAEQPLLYPVVADIREGYRRSVCGADSIYYPFGEISFRPPRQCGIVQLRS